MSTGTKTIQQSAEVLRSTYEVPLLPLPAPIETPADLRASARAHRHLAELKGRAVSVPNPTILLDTLTLPEARASYEVENIVTTQDWMYRADLFSDTALDPAAKEVARYRTAVKRGFDWLRSENSRLTNDLLIGLYQLVTSRADGFRIEPETVIGNAYTGEIVYVPPQDANEVVTRMIELEPTHRDKADRPSRVQSKPTEPPRGTRRGHDGAIPVVGRLQTAISPADDIAGGGGHASLDSDPRSQLRFRYRYTVRNRPYRS